jgi:hypothetical protein
MPAWAIRPVLPSGVAFNGEIVYNSTLLDVPNTLKKHIESIEIRYSEYNLVKNTGFEHKKYRVKNTGSTSAEAEMSIMLVGNLDRWVQSIFITIARACHGSGMLIEFFDDIATDKQYIGRWVNAGDFVDNSELICGGSIDLVITKITEIGDLVCFQEADVQMFSESGICVF